MTEKLYHHQTYSREMDAQVIQEGMRAGRPAVLLDRTIFYPASGGQMHDTGWINGIAVMEVQIEGDEIWHILEKPLHSASAHGVLNWERRFDFMQQHSGFHLLAGAFLRSLGIHTLSSHLGEEESTIDVSTADLATEALEEIETLANSIIWEDRPINAMSVSAAELESLNLRKAPQVEGPIRLIEIKDLDLDPCGGTHVSSTGQVGLVKIISRERIRQDLRFTFLAGSRAWRLVQQQHRTISDLCQQMTTEASGLGSGIEKLQEENKALRKNLQQKIQLLAEQSLEEICATAGKESIIVHLFADGDMEMVRFLASHAVRRRPGTYLFAGITARAALVFATSDNALDLRPAFAAAIEAVEGRGGGNAGFVQGSGARIDNIEEALRLAQEIAEKANKKY